MNNPKAYSFYVIEVSWYRFKLDCYNFRINVISIEITKKTAIEYTQKEMRKEFKIFITHNQLIATKGIMTEVSLSLLVITLNMNQTFQSKDWQNG